MDVSHDGKEALVTVNEKKYGPNPNKESSSYIARINLATGVLTKLTEVGNYAEFQSPQLSPEKKHNAWTQRVMPPFGKITPTSQATSRIVVDGNPILDCSSLEWLDERRIVAYCDPDIVVLEVDTGRKLASTRVPTK